MSINYFEIKDGDVYYLGKKVTNLAADDIAQSALAGFQNVLKNYPTGRYVLVDYGAEYQYEVFFSAEDDPQEHLIGGWATEGLAEEDEAEELGRIVAELFNAEFDSRL